MKEILPKINLIALSLFVALFILRSVVSSSIIDLIMALLTVTVFAAGYAKLSGLNKKIIGILLGISALMLISGTASVAPVAAINENAGIAVLLLTVPLLGFILSYAPYERIIERFVADNMHTGYRLYALTLGLVVFLAALMSIGSLPFAYQLMRPSAAHYSEKVLHLALTRGFIMTMYWAPNLICVAIVMKYVHVSWEELALAGVVFAFGAYVVAMLLGLFELRGIVEKDRVIVASTRKTNDMKRALILLVQVAAILCTIMLITNKLGMTIFFAVSVVALTMPLLIALITGKLQIWINRLRDYCSQSINAGINQYLMFITIGIFGHVLGHSTIILQLQKHCAFIGELGTIAVSLIIISIIALLSLVGLHPIITISALAVSIGGMELALNKIQLGMSLISGYILYSILSPFSAEVMIMSAITNKNTYQMGIGLNWHFALLYMIVVEILIYAYS